MVRLSVVNSGTLKRKLKLVTYTGLIAVASYGAIKGISAGGQYLTEKRKEHNVEKLIDQGYYADAKNAIALLEEDGKINPFSLVELKQDLHGAIVMAERKAELAKAMAERKAELVKLEFTRDSLATALESQRKVLAMTKDSVNTSIDMLIKTGQLGDAECTLSQFEKLYTKPQIDSITNIIHVNSEPYIYSMTKDSVNGTLARDKYLMKFPNGPHRKELITNLLNHSLEKVIDLMNKSANIFDVSKLLFDYKNNLEQFKSEGVVLSSDISANLVCSSDVYLASPEFVSQYNISKVSKDMSVMVSKDIEEKLNELYVKERSKNIPAGAIGTVFSYNDINNLVFVKFDKNCSWSRDWNFVSEYWTKDQKNVVAYSVNELLYSKASQKKNVISKDLSNVLNLLDQYYSKEKK